MPKREILHRGDFYTIELAITANGRCPGKKFIKERSDIDKILRIIKRLADIGKVKNTQQFKKLEDDFFEFKAFQMRMPCYFTHDGRVVITHGFIKQGNRTEPDEIERMKRIRDEYEKRT
jgi:hypothetical protein